MTDLCVRCGIKPPDTGNNKCLGCFKEVDPVGYQQTIDHRARKARQAEEEKRKREEKANPKNSPTADENRAKIMRDRDSGFARPTMIECIICVQRGNVREMGMKYKGGHCPFCFQRHRTALYDTGWPDLTTGHEDRENHFPPEILDKGI